jgi:hypothetical protein
MRRATLLLLGAAVGGCSGGGGATDGGGDGDGGPVVCRDLSDRLPPPVTGDLWVAVDGDDAADGATRASAFATIGHALEVLRPGQTLVIAPGEYFGAVRVEGLGSADAETVIRAEIPGTVVLRGDVPAPEFRPLTGYDRVWVADRAGDADVQVMNELDTLRVLPRVPNVAELEFTRGRFHQDRAAGRLYVSASDAAPADRHSYTLTVVGTHGLYLDAPVRVRVEGLAVTASTATSASPTGSRRSGRRTASLSGTAGGA